MASALFSWADPSRHDGMLAALKTKSMGKYVYVARGDLDGVSNSCKQASNDSKSAILII